MHASRLLLASFGSFLAAAAGFSAQPVTSLTGWHQFRGPNRDGISMEKGLLKSWPAEGPKLLWEINGAGAGMGSATVGGGKIFVIGNRKDGAALTSFDLATQKEVWSTVISEKRDQPNGAPTFDGERVYAVSKDGVLICCDAATGKALANNCTACHGDTGITSNPAWPSIAGQQPSYLVNVLKAFRAGLRKDPMMAGVARSLSDADIANLAAYYAAQSCRPATR